MSVFCSLSRKTFDEPIVIFRLGAVAGVIFLGCLVAVTLIVTPSLRNPVPVALLDNTLLKMGPSPAFRPSRSSALSEKAPESLPVSDAKLLGLKESDMRLLKVSANCVRRITDSVDFWCFQ